MGLATSSSALAESQTSADRRPATIPSLGESALSFVRRGGFVPRLADQFAIELEGFMIINADPPVARYDKRLPPRFRGGFPFQIRMNKIQMQKSLAVLATLIVLRFTVTLSAQTSLLPPIAPGPIRIELEEIASGLNAP